jgi:hypothetical protein
MGVKHFLDEKAIDRGEPITTAVRAALDDCYAVVVIISHASLKSAWVPYEVGYALGASSMGAKKKVIPLITDPTLDVPGYLVDLKYATDIKGLVSYFRSPAWNDYVSECRSARPNDIRQLRRINLELEEFLRKYQPGGREPDL